MKERAPGYPGKVTIEEVKRFGKDVERWIRKERVHCGGFAAPR